MIRSYIFRRATILNKFYERVSSRTMSQRLQFITRFVRFARYRSSNRTHFNDRFRKTRIQGRRSLGTITSVCDEKIEICFTSPVTCSTTLHEKPRILLLLFILLCYPESFDEKLISNLLYYEIQGRNQSFSNIPSRKNIGLHVRKEKEILAQRRMERQKVPLGTIRKFNKKKKIHLLVLLLKKRKRKNWKKKDGKIKKREKFV